jgi:hypothetical protein
VARCITAGLVGGEALSIDASLIKADVDKRDCRKFCAEAVSIIE